MVTMAVAWLLTGDRPARISLAASVIGLFGVGLLVLQNGLDRPLDALGLLAGLLAVVLSSVGFVLTKKWTPPVDVVTATSWQLVAGGVVLVPIALVVEGAPPTVDLPAAGALVYLGLVGSGLAYVLWFRGLRLLGPTSASIIGLVNPVVGVLLGVALLGETFGPVHLIAMLLIVGSVLAAQEPVRAALARPFTRASVGQSHGIARPHAGSVTTGLPDALDTPALALVASGSDRAQLPGR
jgi:probable blue pigment (indigoidine) exporter